MNHQAQKIKDLLATIPEFVGTNGKLLMSNIRAAAKSYNHTLLSTLLSDDTAKEMFFRSAGGG